MDELARPGTRVATAAALRTAIRLLHARWRSVLVAMLCIQGAPVWTLPLRDGLDLLRGSLT